jgi:glycyl-tRNA synthetase
MAMLSTGFHFAETGKFSVVEAGATIGGSQLDIDALSAACTRLASSIKEMKKAGAEAGQIKSVVSELNALRDDLAAATVATGGGPVAYEMNRKLFDETVLRRMFVVPAFEIHGGVTGLFDLGPPGCALKANLVDAWRRHFVHEEKMLEMECTCLTPEPVLKTSGHVDRFTDLMVKDVETGDCYRADKLLEDHIDELLEGRTVESSMAEVYRKVQRQADAFSPEELGRILGKYGVVAPVTGNALTAPFAFNLMFETKIGPSGALTGYLRPETAQGLFVNFRRLLDYNNGRVPFAAAQVGLGFRNEIAPKNGLLRVREFTMAEIEHFVNPTEKEHPKFASVRNVMMQLFDREAQLGTGRVSQLTIGIAVASGKIANETLAYFMARTQLFMVKIGMDVGKLRFRQHLSTEMAHYAADCWDLEILTAYGWVECVGHADRACYDLEVHSAATGIHAEAFKQLNTPIEVEAITLLPNRKKIGLTFKKEQKLVYAALETLQKDDLKLRTFETALAGGEATVQGESSTSWKLTKDMLTFKRTKKLVQVVKFVPSVIEPSFGIGRILHALLEHSFHQRDAKDEQRVVMRFIPTVAPIKCGIYNLQTNANFMPLVKNVEQLLTDAGVSNKSDTSGQSVGKRYARADELGTPFGVTVDFDTLIDQTVTLRERDTMVQVRVKVSSLPSLLRDLCGLSGNPKTWAAATAHLQLVSSNVQTGSVNLQVTSRCIFSRPAKLM